MDREKVLVLIIAVVSVSATLYFQTRNPNDEAIELVRLGVLTATQRSVIEEKFLTDLATEEINAYCMNKSLPYRFEPVFKCANASPPNAIELTDWFNAENISIVIGYRCCLLYTSPSPRDRS